MFTLYSGNDRFSIITKLKQLEESGFSYFHGDLSKLISIVSSTGLFESGSPKKLIANIETSKLEFNKKFLETLAGLSHNDDIVFVYFDNLRSNKDIKEAFDSVESFSIKDNKEIFALLDAVFSKNEKKSLELTTTLLEKYDSFYLLSMLFYQLKNLLYSYYDAKALSKMHPFVAQKTRAYKNNFSKKSITNILKSFVELDFKLKSTNLGSDALYSVIYFILSI